MLVSDKFARTAPLLALVLFVLSACAPAVPFATEASATPVASTRAPVATSTPGPQIDFALKDLSGADVRVSDYAGKVVLVNFWASWCTPCKEEMPVLEQFYRDHRQDGFVILAVNTGDSPADAASYIQKNGYTFPVWSDPSGNQLIKLGVNGLPFSLVLDRQGRRVARWYGGTDRANLDQVITPLLSTP